jgi:hypothetical protein
MKRALRRNRGRERGRGPSELVLPARGVRGSEATSFARSEWRQSHTLGWGPVKGTGRWKALQVVKVVALHGVMMEAVLAASKKSMRAKAPSTEPGSRQGCQRFGCAAHGGEESSPSYDAVQPTEAGLGVVKRSALPPYRAKVRWQTARKLTRRGCSLRVVGWQKSVGRIY